MSPAASRLVSEKVTLILISFNNYDCQKWWFIMPFSWLIQVLKPNQGTREQQQLHHPKKNESIPSKAQQGVKPTFVSHYLQFSSCDNNMLRFIVSAYKVLSVQSNTFQVRGLIDYHVINTDKSMQNLAFLYPTYKPYTTFFKKNSYSTNNIEPLEHKKKKKK